jgi:hypothetical protein
VPDKSQLLQETERYCIDLAQVNLDDHVYIKRKVADEYKINISNVVLATHSYILKDQFQVLGDSRCV